MERRSSSLGSKLLALKEMILQCKFVRASGSVKGGLD